MSILSVLGQTSPYYDSTYYSNTDPLFAAGVSMFIMSLAIGAIAITYIIVALFMSRIFKKAGVETWKAWVPVYNNWTLLELGGQKGYWAVVALIPLIGIVGGIFILIAMYHIGLKLGKEGAFVLLAIFLPLVWMAWLAFDKSTWHGKIPQTHSAKTDTPGTPTPLHR